MRKIKPLYKLLLMLTLAAMHNISKAQGIIPLYPGKIPNSIAGPDEETNIENLPSIRYIKVSKPTLQLYLPAKNKATGAAVVIIPGGSYVTLSYSSEGIAIAQKFAEMGIAAFILKYRLPSDKTMPDKTIGPLQDAQQAIKTVRGRAKEWGIDTAKVGIIGFSAGGHLASTAGTHFNHPVIEDEQNISLRPDFMILVYPVINLSDELMHKGSRNNLLGPSPGSALIKLYSNDEQVTPQTPPTFLLHAGDDKTVKVENSLVFYQALLKNGIPAEMHIYPKGGHGFGLIPGRAPNNWMDLVDEWLKGLGIVK